MKRVFKWGGIALGCLLLLAIIFGLYVNFYPFKIYENHAPDLKVSLDSAKVAEGHRIAEFLCKQCHKSKDGKLGGSLMEDGQFGKVFSSNITQHPSYGITNYTDGELAYLLRTGIKKDGSYSPPWMIKLPNMSDEDIENVIAFFRSDHSLVQPSDNNPPATEYSFLSKMLIKLGAFAPLPYPDKPISAPDSKNKVAFGKYLATAKFDCYGCHSKDFATVNMLEPEKTPGFFAGSNPMLDLEGNLVLSANLTMDKATGIGNWTEADFVKALCAGITPDNRMVRYPMIPYTLISEVEAEAIWAYLKTIPVIENKDLMNRFEN